MSVPKRKTPPHMNLWYLPLQSQWSKSQFQLESTQRHISFSRLTWVFTSLDQLWFYEGLGALISWFWSKCCHSKVQLHVFGTSFPADLSGSFWNINREQPHKAQQRPLRIHSVRSSYTTGILLQGRMLLCTGSQRVQLRVDTTAQDHGKVVPL